MKDRIDPLIAERAPWLFRDRPDIALLRRLLDWRLGYQRTLDVAESVRDMDSVALMSTLGALIAQKAQITGLDNLPRQGPALIVANHPTGIADGIILFYMIRHLRPDTYFFANKDILRVAPQMADMLAPVEWRLEKRSHSKTRETMAFTRAAVAQGRLGVIFPSGRLAKRRWLNLHERPWMASAAMIARKFELPVIPVHISACNSAQFYLFDKIHPTLRDITLFYEGLNKADQPFNITLGEPISPNALPKTSEDGIAMLRRATLSLGGPAAPAVSLVAASKLRGALKA